MKKEELKIELARMTSRSDAHYQNYLQMLGRIDKLAVELREAREANAVLQEGVKRLQSISDKLCEHYGCAQICEDAFRNIFAELRKEAQG